MMRVAPALAASVPVMYYVAPQVWAWAPWRIKKVRRLTDHVACLLPFEQDYFRSRGVAATFVGHPLMDGLPPQRSADQCPDMVQAWHGGRWRVALLPGSRGGEITQLTPALVETARAIRGRWPEARCTFTAVDQTAADRIRKQAGLEEIDLVVGQTAEVLAESHFAVAASGTVTLEVAHFGVPMVVIYRVSAWQRLLYQLVVRHLIRTPQLSLVNILADGPLVPELMPSFRNIDEVVQTVLTTMDDYGGLMDTRRKLLETVRPLQAPNGQTAAANAADLVLDVMKTAR